MFSVPPGRGLGRPQLPDATGLELIAGEIRDSAPGAVIATKHDRGRAEIEITPESVHPVVAMLKERGYTFLASLHGLDYWPDEPRLGVIYELLDMKTVDRISVKTRVTVENPTVASVIDLWSGADHPEREVFDMFGVIFEGHPDLRRILMPEDYEGHPQRRDFPVGGEEVIFTYNEKTMPGWTE
jgi:NADH-quinone oxidoreductase subunit C